MKNELELDNMANLYVKTIFICLAVCVALVFLIPMVTS